MPIAEVAASIDVVVPSPKDVHSGAVLTTSEVVRLRGNESYLHRGTAQVQRPYGIVILVWGGRRVSVSEGMRDGGRWREGGREGGRGTKANPGQAVEIDKEGGTCNRSDYSYSHPPSGSDWGRSSQ